MTELKGSCLCGATRYTCTGDPMVTAVCHCAACQKSTGSAFSVVVLLKKEQLRLQGSALKVYDGIGDSGKATHRHFCPQCGSTIYAEMDARPGVIGLKAGTLDNPQSLKPTVNVYWRDHQPWITAVGDLAKHETVRRT